MEYNFALAAFGASLATQFLHPLDIIKTRMQSHDGRQANNLVPKYKGIQDAMKKIYKTEGIRGFTKGFWLSFVANGISRSLFFYFFEDMKYFLFSYYGNDSKRAVFYSSIFASITAILLTQPLWVTLTRTQLNIKQSGISNVRNCVIEIYKQHGYKGYYRGIQLSMMLSIHGIIQMNIYEFMMRILKYKVNQNMAPIVSGLGSQGLAVYITYPLITIRTRIQQNQFVNQYSEKYISILDVINKTYKFERIQGFYKGIIPALIKGLPQKAIYFFFYEKFKNVLGIGRQDKISSKQNE